MGSLALALCSSTHVFVMLLWQESLPKGMALETVSSGRANVRFQGYYTAALTLAEAPEVHLDPNQAEPSPPLQQGQQQGHPQQEGPERGGNAQKPSEVVQEADSNQAAHLQEAFRHGVTAAHVGPHKEKYRWRLLSYELLPGTSTPSMVTTRRCMSSTLLSYELLPGTCTPSILFTHMSCCQVLLHHLCCPPS